MTQQLIDLCRGGSSTRLQYFLVASTCLLYLVGAALFSRAVWSLEQGKWNNLVGSDASELGSGPGSYDIDKVVWHVNVSNRHQLGKKAACLMIAVLQP
jgi:high-affinity iron transporter